MFSEIDSVVFPHLNADLARVRDVLGPARLQSRPELTGLTDAAPDDSHRMVRPTLTLLSYYLLTDPAIPAADRAVRGAAAVELLHLGSLYHDDVIDHAYQRRGRPSANAVWGAHLAVLGGDSVTFSGTRLLAELGQREVLVGMTVGEQMCEGVMIEAADLYSPSRTEQSYLDGIAGKTAALLSLACRIGAMQAGRDEADEEALAMFGRRFGMAYQLFDDILDLTSTAEEMGKPVNADLSEGVYTLPVIRAASRDRNLARLLRRTMTEQEAARARELVIASGAVDEARTLADLLKVAAKLKWLQAPAIAPPAGYYYPALVAHPVVVTNFRGIFNEHIAAHILAFVLAFARGFPRLLPTAGRTRLHPGPARHRRRPPARLDRPDRRRRRHRRRDRAPVRRVRHARDRRRRPPRRPPRRRRRNAPARRARRPAATGRLRHPDHPPHPRDRGPDERRPLRPHEAIRPFSSTSAAARPPAWTTWSPRSARARSPAPASTSTRRSPCPATTRCGTRRTRC